MTATAGPTTAGPTDTLAVTVVICAYSADRWPDLLAAVRSVRDQLEPYDELLVVIDHNPDLLSRTTTALAGTAGTAGTDSTAGVRVLANDNTRGLSGARNTGVASAGGTVVAFLDDDATARPGWLAWLRKAFLDDAVVAAGTTVLPRWAGGRAPRWFPPEFGWVVGCGYRGLPTDRAVIRNPIGASMAIRRAAITTAGGFSELVGRVGTLPVGCEETELCIRMVNALPGAMVVHEPAGAVDHAVPAARQTLRYFLRRCFHEGRSKWAVTRLSGARSGLSAERRYLRVVLPTGVAGGLAGAVLRLDPFALARAAAIVLGLSTTVVGFGVAAVGDTLGKAPSRTGREARAGGARTSSTGEDAA